MPVRQTMIVDASYDQWKGRTGIGIAVHETDRPGRNGMLIDQIGECYEGIPPGQGEIFAVYRALEIGLDRGFRILRIRSDYNQMRKGLKKSYEAGEGSNGAGLKECILRLAKHYDSVHFGYKPKRKSQMARGLAREAVRDGRPLTRPDLSGFGSPTGMAGTRESYEPCEADALLLAERKRLDAFTR